MSSKSTSSNRQSSPRAMPVETIITRFKSAQQKKKLHEMDRSMAKVTELLRSPVKPRMKRKAQTPVKNDQKCNNITSNKEERESQKKKRKNKPKVTEKVEEVKEFCPLKLKRDIVFNKISLKPKHELKVIARTNKRKRTIPKKGLFPQDYLDLTMDGEYSELTRDPGYSERKCNPNSVDDETSVVEMIQLIEESGSFGDDDLLEILTCPSPVWWEDPPDGFNEDALFTRPRSTAEMYPSVRSQLQEHLGERRRSSTPNVLSRRERIVKRHVATVDNVTDEDKEELRRNNNNDNDIDKKRVSEVLNNVSNSVVNNESEVKQMDMSNSSNNIDVGISLNECDEKFIKKRSKLELVLGNLKDRNVKNNDTVGAMKTYEKRYGSEIENSLSNDNYSKVNDVNDTLSKEISLIKNSYSNDEKKDCEALEDEPDNLKSSTDKESKASVSEETRSEISDDENLTDMSFQDDGYLNDLENMEIPMQESADIPKPEQAETKNVFFQALSSDNKADFAAPNTDFLVQTDKLNSGTDICKLTERPINKCNAIRVSFDATHSDKGSSMIEDFLELKLIEDDGRILINNEENEYPKCKLDTFGTKPFNGGDNCKQSDKNMTTSVIKIKNCDSTRMNVLKIESVVPKKLPPLINSGVKTSNRGCVNENLPPLKRNPAVIKLNVDTPKLMENKTSFDTSESCRTSLMQDNVASISGTKVGFLDDDGEDKDNTKNVENNNDFEVSDVTKWRPVIEANELLSYDANVTRENEISINELTVKENNNYTKNKVYNAQEKLYNDLTQINADSKNEFKALEFQSLTITKVNDSSCCKLKTDDVESVTVQKNDLNIINHDDIIQAEKNTDDVTTFRTENYVENDLNKSVDNKIETNAKDVSETLTIYKIVSDSSGNEESEIDLIKEPANEPDNLQNKLNSKESNFGNKREDSIVLSDNNKDKMDFYYKKWKNSFWKTNDRSKIEDTKVGNDNNEANSANREDSNAKTENIDDMKTVKVDSTDRTDRKRKERPDHESKKKKSKRNSKTLKNASTNKEKNINDSGTTHMRYCRTCASIFDTPQCSYCYRITSTDNEQVFDTDYALAEQDFVCDICGYKVVTKDGMERHIMLRHIFK